MRNQPRFVILDIMKQDTAMIDWSRIDTVILDMDGTVLDLHFDNRFWLHHLPAVYAERNGLSHEAALTHLVGLFAGPQGSLNWYCTDYWSQQVGFDVAGLKPALKHLIRERNDAFRFLAAVQASGRRLWLATNAHRASLELKLAETTMGRYFDVMVSSHDYGAPKEDQAFWQALQTAHPFNPARALFIDDSEAVLDSAARFGIGQLLTIATPDSRKPARQGLRYPAIDDFAELGLLPESSDITR